MYANTDIDYPAPAHLLSEDNYPSDQFVHTEGDHKYARTEDGKLYARMELSFLSDSPCTWVKFHVYVQLSEADWNALRDGTAKFVTGKIENDLFLDFGVFGQFCQFEPHNDEHTAGCASFSLGLGDGLDPIFDALSERERELEAA